MEPKIEGNWEDILESLSDEDRELLLRSLDSSVINKPVGSNNHAGLVYPQNNAKINGNYVNLASTDKFNSPIRKSFGNTEKNQEELLKDLLRPVKREGPGRSVNMPDRLLSDATFSDIDKYLRSNSMADGGSRIDNYSRMSMMRDGGVGGGGGRSSGGGGICLLIIIVIIIVIVILLLKFVFHVI